MSAPPEFEELQRRMARRAEASPRFHELLSSPPKLDLIETDGPRLMAIARSPPLGKLKRRDLYLGPEPEPEPEPQPEPQLPKISAPPARLPSTVGGVVAPTPETVRLMDVRFAERLVCSEISRATGLLSPDQFWDTLCVASRAAGRPEPAAANTARLQRIAELTVAVPSTGATRDEFGVAMHLAEHSGSANSITPASVASLRRIWQLHRKMMETQSELEVLRAELDTPSEPTTVDALNTAVSTPRPHQQMGLSPQHAEDGQHWLEVGMTALQSGEYADAARSFSRALRADPDSASALRGLTEATKGVQLSSMSPTQIDELAHTGYAGGTALGQALGLNLGPDSPRSNPGSPAIMQTPPPKQQYGDVAAVSPAVSAIKQRTRRERLLRRGAVALAAVERKNLRMLDKATKTVKREVVATARARLSSTSSSGRLDDTPTREHV